MQALASSKLLTADTVGTSTPLGDDVGLKAANTMVTVQFGVGTGAGTYVVEVADSPTFAGTWAVLATIAWAVANSIKTGLVTGPWKALRVRNTAAVTGGTAEVTIQVNG